MRTYVTDGSDIADVQASGGLVFLAAYTENGDDSGCPNTLCTAIKTGTSVSRRGIFREVGHTSIKSRQVDTAALRKKLVKKRLERT